MYVLFVLQTNHCIAFPLFTFLDRYPIMTCFEDFFTPPPITLQSAPIFEKVGISTCYLAKKNYCRSTTQIFPHMFDENCAFKIGGKLLIFQMKLVGLIYNQFCVTYYRTWRYRISLTIYKSYILRFHLQLYWLISGNPWNKLITVFNSRRYVWRSDTLITLNDQKLIWEPYLGF